MDFNGDGKDDRDLLNQAVATAGALIDNDVDITGTLHIYGTLMGPGDKPKITERTKFLVIGKVPEVADVVDVEREGLMKMHSLKKDLEDTARERGVRVLSLGDFLNYIGYKNQQRLFVPGDTNSKWNLKSGRIQYSPIDEAIGGSRKDQQLQYERSLFRRQIDEVQEPGFDRRGQQGVSELADPPDTIAAINIPHPGRHSRIRGALFSAAPSARCRFESLICETIP